MAWGRPDLEDSVEPLCGHLNGLELILLLPQLTDDTRQSIASYLPCSNRARCLLLTSESYKQDTTAERLETLSLTNDVLLGVGKLDQATQLAKLALAVRAPEHPDAELSRQLLAVMCSLLGNLCIVCIQSL